MFTREGISLARAYPIVGTVVTLPIPHGGPVSAGGKRRELLRGSASVDCPVSSLANVRSDVRPAISSAQRILVPA